MNAGSPCLAVSDNAYASPELHTTRPPKSCCSTIPLAAVDAHVGHHILQNCILNGPLSEKTRILVTHHLDVLPRADLVLVLDRDMQNIGRIIQQGTYAVSPASPAIPQTVV